jgi:hypothetical protein
VAVLLQKGTELGASRWPALVVGLQDAAGWHFLLINNGLCTTQSLQCIHGWLNAEQCIHVWLRMEQLPEPAGHDVMVSHQGQCCCPWRLT